MVEVAAPAGRGLDELRDALDQLLASTPHAADRGRPRLWVDRVFAAKGAGTVVTGTLTGGAVAVGGHVVVGPAARPARVRAIQSLGRSQEQIGPGNRVALNLNGVEHADVVRGDAVVEPGRWRPTRRLDASLEVLAGLDHEVSRRGAYVAYLGSGELPVKVRVLGAEAVPPGGRGFVRLHLARAAAAAPRGPVRAPGERPLRDGRGWRGPRRGAGPPGVQGPARPIGRPGGGRAPVDRRGRAGGRHR